MAIKLVCIDVDRTLLTNDNKITDDVKNAIAKAKEQGVKIVITTGRPLPGVKGILEELNLNEEGDIVITYNGGLVQLTETGKELARFTLTYENFLEIEQMARRVNVHLHTITNNSIYTSNRDISPYTVHESFLVNMPIRYRTPEEITPDFEIVKMMYIDEPEILDAVIEKLPQEFVDKYTTVKSAPFYYEILNPKASKGAALLALAEKLGLDVSETMAIGDADNDLSMLEVAGLSVGMGNATENVRKVVDVMTATNEESGVARALEDYVLK
jgi:Cof subfamily protein (haloacid dehalogenase superfamily)